MQIIIKGKGTESARRRRKTFDEILKHYYGREIRDGSRFRSKAGTKEQIKGVYK